MGEATPLQPKNRGLQRVERTRQEPREGEDFPRLSREDLEHPERYHQRLQAWIRKQGRQGRY